MTAPRPDAMTEVPRADRRTRRLRRLLRRRPDATTALVIVLALFVIAALAPFLSQDAPLRIARAGGSTWPLLAALTRADLIWLGALAALIATAVVAGATRRRPARSAAIAGVAVFLLGALLALWHAPTHLTRRFHRELELRAALVELDRDAAADPVATRRALIDFVERVGTDSLIVAEEAERRIAVVEEAGSDRDGALARLAAGNADELELLAEASFPPNPHAPGAPSFVGVTRPGQTPRHRLGTDAGGRDLLAQLIHGARHSLSVSLTAAVLSALIGLALGAAAGYFGGRVDWIILRLIEIVSCLPALFILVVLAAFLPPETRDRTTTMIGFLALVLWPHAARLVRTEVQRLVELDYVVAARALGATPLRILRRHVLPNAITPLIQNTTLTIGAIVLLEASLSFLGLGPAGQASWGRILDDARKTGALAQNWHLAVLPGAAVFLTVLAFNLLGDTLRDARDPREVVV